MRTGTCAGGAFSTGACCLSCERLVFDVGAFTITLSSCHFPTTAFWILSRCLHTHHQYNEQEEEEEGGSHFLAVAFAGGFFATGTFDDAGGGTLGSEVDGKSRHGQEIRLSEEKEWIRRKS